MAFSSKETKDQSKGTFVWSFKWLGNIVAIVLTFLSAPFLYSATVGWIRDFTHSHYGPALVNVTDIGWAIAVGLIVFFLSRASTVSALMMGALYLANFII